MEMMKSDVGVRWDYMKVGDFAEVTTGGTPSTKVKEFWDDGNIPWLNSGELNQDIITQCENFITEKGLESSAARLMPKDTVLIALTGATTGVVGYLTFEACANQSVTGILPSEKHYPKFLYYYLKSIRNKVISESYGGAQKHISQGYVKNLQIPLPPLPIQKRIAEILDAADALKRKDQELLKKYDELAQAIFIDMFGDPVKNEKGWECFPVINYCDCIVPGRDKPKSFTGSIPWVTTDDLNHLSFTKKSRKGIGLTNSEIEFVRAKVIPQNSVIMTCVGDLGIISINEQEIVINQQLHAFQCGSKMNPMFLMYSLNYQKDFMYKMSSSTTVPYMNKTVCNSIPVACPPISLQNLFENKINLVNKQKWKFNETKSNDLFQTLIQKAFKGELVE